MRILILGASSKIAKSLTLSFQDSGYQVDVYERRKEDKPIDEWIRIFASPECTIINCIRGKDLQPDEKVCDALENLKFSVSFIHLSSRIVVSKSSPYDRKVNGECETTYTLIKLNQELLYENLVNINPLVKTSILRLGYFCDNLNRIDHRSFVINGVSKKPKQAVLEYITAPFLAENILKSSEGISNFIEDAIVMEELLRDKKVKFVPSIIYKILLKCVTVLRAHRLSNKIEELVYNGRH